ncbi:MAG: hypothetical protein JWM11_4484 [Planctomycetaceae bacterium]|nr:hypothetical protein [Planctomycetaceae bacterium]
MASTDLSLTAHEPIVCTIPLESQLQSTQTGLVESHAPPRVGTPTGDAPPQGFEVELFLTLPRMGLHNKAQGRHVPVAPPGSCGI